MKDEFNNEFLLSKTMSLLKLLLIDIHENVSNAFIPFDMEERMNEANNLLNEYYSNSYDLNSNEVRNTLNKLNQLREQEKF